MTPPGPRDILCVVCYQNGGRRPLMCSLMLLLQVSVLLQTVRRRLGREADVHKRKCLKTCITNYTGYQSSFTWNTRSDGSYYSVYIKSVSVVPGKDLRARRDSREPLGPTTIGPQRLSRSLN